MPRLRGRLARRRRGQARRRVRAAAAAGPRREGQGPAEAEVDRGLDAEERALRRRARRSSSPATQIDLDRLPIQTCWPLDAAPFITLPAVITKDPRTGGRNVGMYRMQKLDPRSTAMHWQIHKDGRQDYLMTDGRMDVAVALGLDPVTAYSASAPLPKHIDELMLAGLPEGRARRARPGEDGRPGGARERGNRPRGDHRTRRPDERGALRRPHRLLHPGRGVPRLPPDGDHHAPRRDLSLDRRRPAAAGGRLARQGHGAHLPAGGEDERPGDRRLRPARSPARSTTA